MRTRATVAVILSLAAWLVLGSGAASANRFGPPWQARIIVDRAIVFEQADAAARQVGALPRGSIVAVTGQSSDATGGEWTATPQGFVRSEEVAESVEPWIGEVTVAKTAIYAKPNARDAIRLTAKQGELLRVTGVSPGMQGDPNLWWSTTEGYVVLTDLAQSTNPWAAQWRVPDGLLALNGWWGRAASDANVRAGPTTEAPSVGHIGPGQLVKVLVEGPGQDVLGSDTWYQIDGGRYAGGWVHSSLIKKGAQPQPNTTEPRGGSESGRWIVVDRAHHSITLVDHGAPVFVTYVALGVAGRETPTGTYSTWGKYRADDMTSNSVTDPGGYYDLPNVPNTQYYRDGGFAIHGTYWHDDFGSDQSHGCVNVTWTDGRYLFSQTQPYVGDFENTTPTGQPATDVVILS
jgi:lipoprotein-anchoring transpeptidase ErfK/SrfK